jgi:hypothetical protein
MKIHSPEYYQKMKIVIFLFALTIPLMSGIMFTGHQSSTQKKETTPAIKPEFNHDTDRLEIFIK